jgi:hypothetical protein
VYLTGGAVAGRKASRNSRRVEMETSRWIVNPLDRDGGQHPPATDFLRRREIVQRGE